MEIFELTHKTTGHNVGGCKIDISVVGRGGRVWSTAEAARLIITNQAKFLYDGNVVANLDVLPEIPDST